MHWPVALRHVRSPTVQKTPTDAEGNVLVDRKADWMHTWRHMEALVREGLVKNIGVSNFNITRLERLLTEADVRPAVNQVELHLGLAQPALVQWARDNDVLLEAYSPLGSTGAPARSNPLVQELADKYLCDSAQILCSWQIARGHVVLPKSVTPERIRSNMIVIDLEEADVLRLETEAARIPQQRRVDKSSEWGVDIFREDRNL